jgi:hypothetical protein
VTIAVGPFVIAAALLAIGGGLKAIEPGDTANALRGVGLPVGAWAVRAGGVAEVAVGVWALATGAHAAAILVALSYVAFTGFVLVALVRDAPIASCGCFGKADTPPSWVHIGVNLVAVAAAVVVAIDPGAGLGDVLADQPLAGIPFVLLTLTGMFLAFLALTLLPRTEALVQTSLDGA